jgi:hypothetical protein
MPMEKAGSSWMCRYVINSEPFELLLAHAQLSDIPQEAAPDTTVTIRSKVQQQWCPKLSEKPPGGRPRAAAAA